MLSDRGDEAEELTEELPAETEEDVSTEPEESTLAEESTEELPSEEIPEAYIVEKGDTLLSISRKFYGNDRYIQEICQLNHIEDCDKIFVGEKILLP